MKEHTNKNKAINSFTTLHTQNYMQTTTGDTINGFCILWKMFSDNKTTLFQILFGIRNGNIRMLKNNLGA